MENMMNMFDNKSFEGVMIVLDNSMNITKANVTFLRLMGYLENELDNVAFANLIVPDEKSQFFDTMYQKEIQKKLNLKLYHKSKAFRNFSLMIYEFVDYKLIIGKVIVKSFASNDYFDNREDSVQIENLFKKIEVDNLRDFLNFTDNNISLILDLFPMDVWVKDRYHKYIFVNKSFEKNTKYTLEDVALKDDFEIFEEETANNFVTTDRLAIDSKRSITYSFHSKNIRLLNWTDVTKIPIYNSKGVYIGIVGYGIDTTENKLIEETMQTELNQYKRVVESYSGIIFDMDNSGEITFVTGALKESFKQRGIDIFGGKLFDINSENTMVKEKIVLALNGTFTEITTEIKGVKLHIQFNPNKTENGSYNIVGMINEVQE